MMMKKPGILACAALALLAASCVYPFSAETEDGSGALVIEGDILIGETTAVKIGRSTPIGGPKSEPVHGVVWVEDEYGTTFRGVRDKSGARYLVNTAAADPGLAHRLHVQLPDGREYVSSWEKAGAPPVIDSLSYIRDPDHDRLNIALSMHSQAGSYFKWSYVEDWEYHTQYFAVIKYEAPNVVGYGGKIVPMVYPENTYYCYRHAESSEILTFSTERQTDDRFVDLEFHKIPRSDTRISYLYRIKVDLEPLSAGAYAYWENIKANSEYSGSLFAPTPSEMVGNIRCVQDPDELVMGYINVARRASKTLYLDALDVKFYKSDEPYVEGELIGTDRWLEFILKGYLPYSSVMPEDYSQTYWAPARCVDCTKMGGTRERPDDWPTNH